MEYTFEMKHIVKRYPGVLANDNVSISGKKGSVLCIIGENGAGKSTLMNVLYGVVQPDEHVPLFDKRTQFRFNRRSVADDLAVQNLSDHAHLCQSRSAAGRFFKAGSWRRTSA